MFKSKIIYWYLSIFFICISLSKILNATMTEDFKYGLNVYKKGNCMGCHSWHGNGGGGYGAGVSLRTSELSIEEIINVIKCGRPGTGMPYFNKKSYKSEKCYDTFIDDYDNNYRPVSSKKFLNPRQIEAVSLFVKEVLQGKKLSKLYCESFFNAGSKVCSKLN